MSTLVFFHFHHVRQKDPKGSQCLTILQFVLAARLVVSWAGLGPGDQLDVVGGWSLLLRQVSPPSYELQVRVSVGQHQTVGVHRCVCLRGSFKTRCVVHLSFLHVLDGVLKWEGMVVMPDISEQPHPWNVISFEVQLGEVFSPCMISTVSSQVGKRILLDLPATDNHRAFSCLKGLPSPSQHLAKASLA